GSVHLHVEACPRRVAPHSTFAVRVRLRNLTANTFNSFQPHPVYISYHWGDEPNTSVVAWDGERTRLRPPLQPGGEERYQATVRAPATPGRYTLSVTLVQEGGIWFDQPPTKLWSSRHLRVG